MQCNFPLARNQFAAHVLQGYRHIVHFIDVGGKHQARIIDELGLIIMLQEKQHTDKNQRYQNGVNDQHPKQHAPRVAGKKRLVPVDMLMGCQ